MPLKKKVRKVTESDGSRINFLGKTRADREKKGGGAFGVKAEEKKRTI